MASNTLFGGSLKINFGVNELKIKNKKIRIEHYFFVYWIHERCAHVYTIISFLSH